MSENLNTSLDLDGEFERKKNESQISLTSSTSRTDLSFFKESNSMNQLNFYSTSTPVLNKDDSNNNIHDSGIANNTASSSNNGSPLNEKVASLASSVYTELEKIVKLHGRDTVKDLMSILVNILEALDGAYQEKEEQIVENELLKDDYEKLLLQYEREKQARKDTELKLFQSEDSFAEQKRDYEEKVTSLESIVRMIDLKSKNTTDHVQRLEEKENELKREYTKLHERYTELFKTHCDYMDRTKILFGNENRNDSNNPTKQEPTANNNGNKVKFTQLKKTNSSSNPILDILTNTQSTNPNVNKNDLINIIKSCSRTDINIAINNLLSQELSQSEANNGKASSSDTGLESENSSLTVGNEGSLSSLTSEQAKSMHEISKSQTDVNDHFNSQYTELLDYAESLGIEDDVDKQADNFQSSENFDEHLRVEFDDTASEYSNMASMTQKEYEEEEEVANRSKNDLSLFNELSRENYDITELDDGADLTGMSREVANLIRENSELLQTKHALNVLKDDLIVRLDNFSSEMVLLREELKNLQTIKACLQLRISELEEEAKKSKEELAEKSKKQEEEDESVPISQRKRFTRAEMARVLMERNQYKERLMDLQEAVRWTEMMRANKADPSAVAAHPAVQTASGVPATTVAVSASSGTDASAADQQQEKKKDKTPMWKFFSDLFGSSSSSQPAQQVSPSHSASNSAGSTQHTTSSQNSPSSKKSSPKNGEAPTNAESTIIEKTAKAYEFLKNDNENKPNQVKSSDKNNKMLVKEDGRMQAYGWSLPSKSSLTLSGEASKPITVPVPVYCRPLFETDNNLKMSSSCTVNFSFDPACVKNCQELIEASAFSSFRSNLPTGKSYKDFKSSCIWICNLNENDTHVSILDANKPGDLIEQFILKYLRIYCMQSVAGADGSEYPLSFEKLRLMQSNINETNSKLDLNATEEVNGSGDNNGNKSKKENITFIECESDQDQVSSAVKDPLSSSTDATASTITNTTSPVCVLKMKKSNRILRGRNLFSTRPRLKRRFTKKFSTLTTYSVNLIKFYHYFTEWRDYMLRYFWFFIFIFQVFQIPVKFLTWLLQGWPGAVANKMTPKLLKRSSSFVFERTTLNHLARSSTVKDFINKYVDYDAVMDEWNSQTNNENTLTDVDEFFSGLGSTRRDRIYSHDNMTVNETPLVNLADCFLKSCIYSPGTESDQAVPVDEQSKLLSSLYPTMWMGSQEGWLLVHPTISNVSKSIEKIKLKDAILSIVQNKGRVIVGLADGSIAIFNRNAEGLWDLKNFHLINVDKPSHSIRCLINVNDNVWAGCRNKIYVVNPDECKLLSTIEVHPRKENQIRHMAWVNDGVWVSLRLDSTLRLYHAKTQQHLQYLDIEPFITRMLGSSNIGVSTVRISSLLIGAKRLWLGTGNGVILSLPFNESIKEAVNSTNLSNIPGTGVRVSADPDVSDPNSHIPYCNLSEAQFSFHGHRNAIKFFLNVPIEAIQKLKSTDIPKSKEEAYEKVETMLVLSGGHGYIDFRIGDNGKSSLEKRYNEIKNQAVENKAASLPSSNKHERSHLIVWQLNNNNS